MLPHLRRACGAEWLLTGERPLEDGVYEVTLSLAGDREGVHVHRDVIRLLSAIAEAVFFVRQREPGVFECVTGVLDGDSPGLGSHSHLVRLIVM
ncbi:hypothetical protein ACFHYQ_28270 [Sphaerimonospora cavernae]|uniref:Uncharacterized protein n=1 Tax=Sphaerimonospora cavernae TaxID=1740611 RepID=A0ABV6UDC2_9ACTN